MGEVDDGIAMDGSSSVTLHTEEAYETEPSNNWSQIVLTDVASKELRLTGHIRTEGATGAALWLQCFTKNPARVIAAQTSGLNTPVHGTMDWTAVELRLTAPERTDFLVVRCVLKGEGTAWFDAMELVVEEEESASLEPIVPIEDPVQLEGWEQGELGQDILKLSESIQQSIRELESSNTVLLQQITSVQRELAEYRLRAQEEAAAASAAPLETLDRYQVRHPLVPHNWGKGDQN